MCRAPGLWYLPAAPLHLPGPWLSPHSWVRCVPDVSVSDWLAGLTAGSQRRPWRERGKRKSSEGTCQTWMAPPLRHTLLSPSEFYRFQLRTNETQMTAFKISDSRNWARRVTNKQCRVHDVFNSTTKCFGIMIRRGYYHTDKHTKKNPKSQRLGFFLLLPTSAALGRLWFSCFVLDQHVHESQGSCIMWLDLTGETFH